MKIHGMAITMNRKLSSSDPFHQQTQFWTSSSLIRLSFGRGCRYYLWELAKSFENVWTLHISTPRVWLQCTAVSRHQGQLKWKFLVRILVREIVRIDVWDPAHSRHQTLRHGGGGNLGNQRIPSHDNNSRLPSLSNPIQTQKSQAASRIKFVLTFLATINP